MLHTTPTQIGQNGTLLFGGHSLSGLRLPFGRSHVSSLIRRYKNPTQLRRPQPQITPIRVVSTSLTAAVPVMTSIQLRPIPHIRRTCLIMCRAHLKRETVACTTVCAGTAAALQSAPKDRNRSKSIVVESFSAMVCVRAHVLSLHLTADHPAHCIRLKLPFHLLLRILAANTYQPN